MLDLASKDLKVDGASRLNPCSMSYIETMSAPTETCTTK